MSDWGATHSTVRAANAGLDMEMPDHDFFGDALASAVASGDVPQSRLDDMAVRILTGMYAAGIMDNLQTGSLTNDATSADHATLARELAAKTTVLLQNKNNVLPLQASSLRTIAVIGDQTTVTGGGSGGVIAPYVITTVDGIGGYYTANRTLNCKFEQDIDYYQAGSPSVPADSKEDCCQKCTVRASCSYFTFVPGSPHGLCYLKQTNAGRVSHPGIVSGACSPYTGPTINYFSGDDLAATIAGAKAADVAIVVGATSSSEGDDRADLTLGKWDEIIEAVTVAQPRNVVVLRNPGAVLMPWRPQAGAIVTQFMPGQEAGNGLADVLFGTVNPSARLPVTFPNDEGETWLLGPQQYPGVNLETVYSEQLLVGYKWYDQQGLSPLFPFGHGLSYTTFAYSALRISGNVSQGSIAVSLTVTNTGRLAGSEVPQLYVTFPAAAKEPPQLMRGFSKIQLDAGESDTVFFQLAKEDLSIWDVNSHSWSVVSGLYGVSVGASSRDLRLRGSFTV
jgi:beta-glucosidase